jgi:hypothetical protein
MDIVKVYPLDAVYDSPDDVPEDVMFLFFLSPFCNMAS